MNDYGLMLPGDAAAREVLERTWALSDRASQLSCLDYLQHVVINSVPPVRFRDCADAWQWALARRVIPAVEYVGGVREDYGGPRRFWITLPKGHDKTTLIARLLNWIMSYSRTEVTAYAAAKDKDQAALIADAMQTEAALNPWMAQHLYFKNWRVIGRNRNRLEILATDAGGSQGIRPDLAILDELTQWTDQKFFTSILSGIDKRPRGVLIIITNAGLKKTWQWDALQAAKQSMRENGVWWVYEAPYRLASWMDEETLVQTRRMLPPSVARMLFDNVWIDPGENSGYVTREQARACVDENLPLRREHGEDGKVYVGSIDYGPVKDRTVCTLVHREENELVVDRMDVFQGSRENHVPVSKVEDWIDDVRMNFRLDRMVFDKYQMESTIQKYRGVIEVEVFEPRGASGNHAMAENLRSLVVNGRLRFPRNCGLLMVSDGAGGFVPQDLVDEFAEVSVKITPSGYRLINLGPRVHDDRCVGLGMSALWAMRAPMKKNLHLSDLWF